MFEGIDKSYFLESIWQKKLCVTSGSEAYKDFGNIDFMSMPEYFKSLGPAILEDFFVLRNGIACHRDVFFNDLSGIQWRTAGNLLRDEHCTLYVRNLNKYDSKVNKLAEGIGNYCSRTAFANLFVTPADSVGLPVHSDLTDFFVLQIYGSKIWRLWKTPEGVEMTKDRVKNAQIARRISKASEPEIITVVPGMIMYVPLGMVHEPVSQEVGSIHLTIGVMS